MEIERRGGQCQLTWILPWALECRSGLKQKVNGHHYYKCSISKEAGGFSLYFIVNSKIEIWSWKAIHTKGVILKVSQKTGLADKLQRYQNFQL